MRNYLSKIITRREMVDERKRLKKDGRKLAFTNGCFDILHPGHIEYLFFSRQQADALLIGLNSDSSVRKNKGADRPIVPQDDRARVIAALECVDYVIIFEEDEPADLIAQVIPDVLIKGEDWAHYVSGRETVESNGGKVVLYPVVKGKSTSNIIDRIKGK